jgi:hypothetical protein
LQAAGIATIEDLARQNPHDLHRMLVQLKRQNIRAPSERKIKIWIRAARKWKEE